MPESTQAPRACHPEHQHIPYAGRACFRCHPYLKNPFLLRTSMHLEVVKSTHVATTSADTTDARDKALSHLAEVHYEIGLQDKQWPSQKNGTTSS